MDKNNNKNLISLFALFLALAIIGFVFLGDKKESANVDQELSYLEKEAQEEAETSPRPEASNEEFVLSPADLQALKDQQKQQDQEALARPEAINEEYVLSPADLQALKDQRERQAQEALEKPETVNEEYILSPADLVFLQNELDKDLSQANPDAIKDDLNLVDSDSDEILDFLEIRYGLDPESADTDGDGFLDAEEIRGGYNPKGEGKIIIND